MFVLTVSHNTQETVKKETQLVIFIRMCILYSLKITNKKCFTNWENKNNFCGLREK